MHRFLARSKYIAFKVPDVYNLKMKLYVLTNCFFFICIVNTQYLNEDIIFPNICLKI